MNNDQESHWAEFRALGPDEVRRRLDASFYDSTHAQLAREWIAATNGPRYQSTGAGEAVGLARSANTLAASAESLSRSAKQIAYGNARTSRAALLVAIAALLLSAWSVFMPRSPRR
jgi:hypothetical protein